ncbi:MAG: hypothetical protein KF726_05220 [Anaerolineae bacterium]|nr:hypothetical protein [Anaerolineae bacterium]
MKQQQVQALATARNNSSTVRIYHEPPTTHTVHWRHARRHRVEHGIPYWYIQEANPVD